MVLTWDDRWGKCLDGRIYILAAVVVDVELVLADPERLLPAAVQELSQQLQARGSGSVLVLGGRWKGRAKEKPTGQRLILTTPRSACLERAVACFGKRYQEAKQHLRGFMMKCTEVLLACVGNRSFVWRF